MPSVLELLVAVDNGLSQNEGAKPQEVVASSEGRPVEKTVAEIAGVVGAAVEKATEARQRHRER